MRISEKCHNINHNNNSDGGKNGCSFLQGEHSINHIPTICMTLVIVDIFIAINRFCDDHGRIKSFWQDELEQDKM